MSSENTQWWMIEYSMKNPELVGSVILDIGDSFAVLVNDVLDADYGEQVGHIHTGKIGLCELVLLSSAWHVLFFGPIGLSSGLVH